MSKRKITIAILTAASTIGSFIACDFVGGLVQRTDPSWLTFPRFMVGVGAIAGVVCIAALLVILATVIAIGFWFLWTWLLGLIWRPS